jgi:hypothetical protein
MWMIVRPPGRLPTIRPDWRNREAVKELPCKRPVMSDMLIIWPKIVCICPWLNHRIELQGVYRLRRPLRSTEADVCVERRNILRLSRKARNPYIQEAFLVPDQSSRPHRDMINLGYIGQFMRAIAICAFHNGNARAIRDPMANCIPREPYATLPSMRVGDGSDNMEQIRAHFRRPM